MGYLKPTQQLDTREPGVPVSPILEISRSCLQQYANKFIAGFSGTTTYAVKANPHPKIIETFYQCGIHTFDVASIQEMELIKNSAPSARFHYHNPIRSTEEIAAAYYDYGCRRYSIDHISQLEKLASIFPHSAGVEIAVRFKRNKKSNSIHAFDTKFGASETEAAALLKQAHEMGFSIGMTFHPGSQTLAAKAYYDHCLMAAKISKLAGVHLDFLNVGGGFPSTYSGLEHDPLNSFFTEIKKACELGFSDKLPRLECEPGRALVAPAGRLLTTVKAVREDKREIFLNDGLYGGLMEVCQFPAMRPHYSHEGNLGSVETSEVEWTAFGPTCDPLDVLPFKLKLPINVTEGDRICFHGLGAYSNATATQFNGYGSVQIEFV